MLNLGWFVIEFTECFVFDHPAAFMMVLIGMFPIFAADVDADLVLRAPNTLMSMPVLVKVYLIQFPMVSDETGLCGFW